MSLQSPYQKDNLILNLSFRFSVDIISFIDELEKKRKFVIGNQLLKSATSIGANAREAQNAESKPDFIHKMKIAAKETEETIYWLELCEASDCYPSSVHLLPKAISIAKVLNKIITSAKE